MSGGRTILVGGVSGLHDRLLAAALRGHGVAAETVGVPDGEALATGRSLLARGHCNPTYYLAGALVERLRRAAPEPAISERFAHLTIGSCGPCRFATYAAEYRRAIAGAGLGAVPVVVIDQLRPGASEALAAIGVCLDARLLAALARAAVLGDVLLRAGCASRAAGCVASAVDGAIDHARALLAGRLASRGATLPILEELATRLAALPRARPSATLRVRITGEFFAANTDGAGGYDLVRWLEARGAAVVPPAVADWLLYLAWQVRRDVERRIPLYAPDPGPRGLLGRDGSALLSRTRVVERGVARLYRRCARSAGVTEPLLDMEDLAALATPHYLADLRAGMGHLEVGTFLAADRDRSADLVVSIKPFGCLPSSAISDGILPGLARRARHAGYVIVETTGDAEAQVESRLELALERARDAVRPLPPRTNR